MAFNGAYSRQRQQETKPRDLQTDHECLDRKRCELALLNSCLSTPLLLLRPKSCAAALELKFYLAARLKADQLLARWSVTETARPPSKREYAGPFAFSFGYQRADLEVCGPPIYPSLQRHSPGCHESTIYTSSGMSAIAALLTASLQCKETIDVVAAADCYGETCELFRSFGPRIRVAPPVDACAPALDPATVRILWLDSSTHSYCDQALETEKSVDLVVLDTTCFWRSSSKIKRTVHRALRASVPIALVRSHAKLDNLGIEYGRLGSVVLVAPPSGVISTAKWTSELPSKVRDAVRLLGVAPVLAHFPPFERGSDYQACSALRTAAIVRSTRRLARGLISRWPATKLKTFQHGLYVTIFTGDATIDEARMAADELATALAAHNLPARHAGSFGFDFVAIDGYSNPVDGCALRICGGDIPPDLSEEIGYRIPDLLRSSRHLADPA